MILEACGGGGGGGGSTVQVVIRGTVDSLIGQGGTATLIVDDVVTTAPVGTDGDYEATLQTANPQDFVAIRALGSGTHARAEFESLLGSAQSVKDAAGADGVLNATEEAKVELNSYQTAIAAILRKIGGGGGKAAAVSVPDLSDAELAKLESQVDPAQALTLGAALELAVKNRALAFPTGFSTTLALAFDPQAADAYVQTQVTQNAVAFQEEAAALAEVAGATIGFTSDDLPGLAHFVTTSSITQQDADELRFDADGTGTLALFWTPAGDNETTFTWAVQDGAVSLSLSPALVNNVSSVRDADGNEVQTDCVQTLSSIRLQPLAVTSAGTSVVADYTATQTCPARGDLSGPTPFTRLGQLVPSDRFLAYTAAEVAATPFTVNVPTPGRTIGSSGSFAGVDTDILDLAAGGTGTAQIRNESVTWTVVGGELRVSFASGATAIYRKLLALGDDHQFRVAAKLTDGDGGIFPTASSSSPVRAISFTSPPGDYHQNGIGTELCVGLIDEFVIRLSVGGGAAQLSFSNRDANSEDPCEALRDNQGQVAAPELFTRVLRPWRIDGATGELLLERTFDNAAQASNNCDPATNPECTVSDQRRVRRLSVSGSREFWLESRRIPCSVPANAAFCGASPIEDAPADHVVRFYDKEPAGSFDPG